MRRRGSVRVFVWLGIWGAMYGAGRLTLSPAVISASPRWCQIAAPYANTAITYLLVVAGLLSFRELSLGRLRLLMQAAIAAGAAIAVAGMLVFVITGSSRSLLPYNTALATFVLLVLIVVVAIPRLSARYLGVSYRGVLAFGTLAFALEAFLANVVRPFGFESPPWFGHLGFGALLGAFGYVALQQAFANEHRLLAVEHELDIARDIQRSILPTAVPEVRGLRMSAAYRPMTAVAGDFYEFVVLDENRVGILVADVEGHGVPAALIASMIKVAMQSVKSCASDPGAVLRELNRVLSSELRGRLVSAAYLWLDTESQAMRYSAAGHPPLLRWSGDALHPVESNGVLFGIMPNTEYPVFAAALAEGDRLVLYTDGVTETESVHGEFFGDRQLERVLRDCARRTPSELCDELLAEADRWRPPAVAQQDDITLIVIDVDHRSA